jgi:pimeloyl-ACP methyl ester carboxylesterase
MERRELLRRLGLGAGASAVAGPSVLAEEKRPAPAGRSAGTGFVEAADGSRLFVRDHGQGPTVVFAAPWALHSSWWEYQTAFLAAQGLRCVSYDRRGHGRSQAPGRGYDFDTLASDLGGLIERLGLRDITLVAHSMGAGEAVRYLARRGGGRVARLVLVAPITPFTLKTADNPDGVERADLEKIRMGLALDRPGLVAAAAAAFFGSPANPVSPAVVEWWTRMIVDDCTLPVMLDLHRAFTETDFRPDLRAITVPTVILQGDRDTSTPLDFTGRRTAALVRNSELRVYPGAAHGLPITHMAKLNADLLALARS